MSNWASGPSKVATALAPPGRPRRQAAFKFDSDESERAGGEQAAARATTSIRPTGPPATPNAADVKASATRAGFKFVPGRGEETRSRGADMQ